MRRKVSIILLAFLLALSMLAACGQTDPADSDSDGSKKISQNNDKDKPEISDSQGKDSVTDKDSSDEDVSDKDIADEDVSDEDVSDEEPSAEATSDTHFTITAPDGWKKSDDSTALLAYESENGASLNIVETYVPDGVTNAIDLAKYEMDDTKDVLSDADYYEPEEVTVGGLDGAYAGMSMDMTEDLTQYNDYVYLIKGGKGYRITGTSYSGDDQGRDDIGTMIDTIKIE